MSIKRFSSFLILRYHKPALPDAEPQLARCQRAQVPSALHWPQSPVTARLRLVASSFQQACSFTIRCHTKHDFLCVWMWERLGSKDCLKHQDFEARWEEPSLGLCADDLGAQVQISASVFMEILACRFFFNAFLV